MMNYFILITVLKSNKFYKNPLVIIFSVFIKKQIYYYIIDLKNILITTCQTNPMYFTLFIKIFSIK